MRSPMAAEVIALMAHDHPWIPGGTFIAHPQLRQRVVDVMVASGRFKARVYRHAGPHVRVTVYSKDDSRATWANLGTLTMLADEAHVFVRLIGEWDVQGGEQ